VLTGSSSGLASGIVTYQFGFQNLGASASATQLYRALPGAAVTLAQISVHPLFRGSIVGMELNANAAKTAGTATFEAYVDGAASGASISWSSGPAYAFGSFSPGSFEFGAGSAVDVRVTTSSTFLPTTADLELILYIGQSATEAKPV
jgi:hypothetical protein